MKAQSYRRIVVVAAVGLVAAGLTFAGIDPVPKMANGFSGRARGTVVAKDGKTSVTVKVNRIFKVSSDNKARMPNSLTGKTIKVVSSGDEGEKAYIEALSAGDRVLLEIKHNSGTQEFEIVQLSETQKVKAGLNDTEMVIPQGSNELALRAEIEKLQKRVRQLEEENRALRQQISDLKMKI